VTEGQRLLAWGLGAFAAVALALGGFMLLLSSPRPAEPGFAVAPVALAEPGGWWRVTLDAADAQRWRGFSFELGREVPLGAAADVLARRFQLRAPGGARALPDGEWSADAPPSGANPVLSAWSSYSYLSHRLQPRAGEFAVRLAGGRGLVRLKVLGFYCAGGEPGCLTLRYRLEARAEETRGEG
jgi:hypothetical protein